jgi:CHAT domain-containing protein
MGQKDIDQELLIRYLLGELPEGERQQLEERYFADDGLYDELRATERDLIDKYVQGELSRHEREKFERYFLSAPGRRNRLKFAAILNEYNAPAEMQESSDVFRGPVRWEHSFNSPYLKIAALIIIVVGAGLGVWRLFFHQPEVSRGVAALRQAYRERRPFEVRITGLGYAPMTDTRGHQAGTDRKYQDLAEKLLLEAVLEKPDAETHHALGQLYLAEGQFDQAIGEFEEALAIDQSNALLHSDMGAALLEKGKDNPPNAESGESLKYIGKGLEHLNKALSLNDSLPEALFNRALCYESLMLTQLAKADWQNYLGKDPTSGWADEARQHLKAIEDKERSSQNNEGLFQSFLTAFQSGQDEEAWKVVSQSQSGNGNFIVERLLDDYLSLSPKEWGERAKDKQLALSYCGNLARENAGDDFISALSRFYSSTPSEHRAALSEARGLMQSGHQHFDRSKLGPAMELYTRAKRIFERVGDDCEARFAEYRIAYCYLRLPDIGKSLSVSKPLADACKRKNYKWLLARTLNSIADAYYSQNRYSEALDYGRQALGLSELIQDAKGQMRNSIQLAQGYQFVANSRESMRFLQRSLSLPGAFPTDANQLRLIYGIAADCFASIGLYTAAVDYEREALRIAIKTANPLLESRCHANLAAIYGKLKNYDEAIGNARQAFEIGERLSNEAIGREMMAYASLRLGDLYRQAGDITKAISSYDQNLEIYDELSFSALSFAAHKGKLLCHIALSDDVAARKELQVALTLFEQYRSKILEESNKNTFFDNEQDIYDVAIGFEHSRMKDVRKAFEYSEASRGRSLLDSTGADTRIVEQEYGPDLRLPEVANPLTLSEIQERLPGQTQILQYAVLDDRLLIWVISKEGISGAEVKLSPVELKAKVSKYLQTISHASGDREEALRDARDLYEVLIKPVESSLDKNKYTCVVPDKILNHIPFGALVSPDSGKYLINDYLLGFSPSSTIFIKCCDTARAKGGQRIETLLSVGNPNFDRVAFPSLRSLPAAGIEAEAIANLYKAKRSLSGEAAGEKQIKREIARSDVVHLATHYIADESAPMLSKLLLAKEPVESASSRDLDGVLQPWEVYGMKPLRTRLIILSACQTSIEQSYRGEGAISIARTFIAAEVPLVVASLWPVASTSTAELMINFHKQRKTNGLSTAEALRAAQLEMLNDPSQPFQQPYYWAPFVLTGGYARF